MISDKKDARHFLTRKSEKQLPSSQGNGADHYATIKYPTITFFNSSYNAQAGVARNRTGSCPTSVSHDQEDSKDTEGEAS